MRIEDILSGQTCLNLPIPEAIEKAAQRYAGLLVARSPAVIDAPAAPTPASDEASALPAEPAPAKEFQEIDIETLQLLRPRSVGVEHVALHAMEKMGFIEKLSDLGVNGKIRSAIVGSVI